MSDMAREYVGGYGFDGEPELTGEEIVRCRDCKYATISTTGVCKYCEMFVLPDVDGYGANPQVNLPLDFFCGFAERKEGGDDQRD